MTVIVIGMQPRGLDSHEHAFLTLAGVGDTPAFPAGWWQGPSPAIGKHGIVVPSCLGLSGFRRCLGCGPPYQTGLAEVGSKGSGIHSACV